DQHDFVFALDNIKTHLDRRGEGRWLRPALVVRIGNGGAGKREFAAAFEQFGGLRFQERALEISYAIGVADASVRTFVGVGERPRAGRRRREIENGALPIPGEIGYGRS